MKLDKIICALISVGFISCQSSPGLRSPAAAGKTAVTCQSSKRRNITQYEQGQAAGGAIKVAFFDADSTLRVSKSGAVSANAVDDVRILPNIGRILKHLQQNKYLVYIVSNQNGVGAGKISCEIAEGALLKTVSLIATAGGVVHGYDFAENGDEFRKPGTGMAVALEQALKIKYGAQVFIDKKNSFMVGDSAFKKAIQNKADASGNEEADLRFSLSKLEPGTHFSNADRLFAQAVGIYFYEATDFFGWRKFGIDVLETSEDVDKFLKICTDCTL